MVPNINLENYFDVNNSLFCLVSLIMVIFLYFFEKRLIKHDFMKGNILYLNKFIFFTAEHLYNIYEFNKIK